MLITRMQKPHCTPPQRTNESAICWRCSSSSPSSVVIVLPSAFAGDRAHDKTGLPSINTVQQPHWAWGWQPFLGEVVPRKSRSTSSSVKPVVAGQIELNLLAVDLAG